MINLNADRNPLDPGTGSEPVNFRAGEPVRKVAIPRAEIEQMTGTRSIEPDGVA
jgi:hypothetical protein